MKKHLLAILFGIIAQGFFIVAASYISDNVGLFAMFMAIGVIFVINSLKALSVDYGL